MANTQVYSFWILLEGKKRPLYLRGLSFNTDTDPNLSDLSLRLGEILGQPELASIHASDLEFLNSERTELPSDITLRVIEQSTSGTNPLVVRYVLSDTTVVVNLRFFKNVTEILLPHTTGLWYTLLAQSWEIHECLQGETKIYFVDQETERNIHDEFTFNVLVKEKRGSDGLINLKLSIRIQGKKPYGEWGIKEMLIILLQDLVIVITEAKITEVRKGIVQNIVQLHTVAEKHKRKREITKPPVVYGIVSTANKWVFLRWSGTPEDPTLEISKEYHVSFAGDLPGSKDVLAVIIQILRVQASALTPTTEAKGQDDEE